MLRSMVIAFALALSISGTGCYGAARTAPRKIDAPPLVDGATLDLDLDTTRYWSDSRGRYVRSTVINGISYGDNPITYHQARSLADPTWGSKLEGYGKLVDRCRRANIPRYIGYASIFLGGLAYAGGSSVFKDNTELQTQVGLGLIGAGAVSYAAGYLFLGGQACREAAIVYERLNLEDVDKSRVVMDSHILELAHITDTFNKRMSRRAGGATAPAPAE